MDIAQAFKFVFEDEEWVKKLLLGVVIMLIPIFGPFALIGYTLVIIRNVKNGEPRPLPEWNDIGQYFVEGLKLWVVNFLYSLPIVILVCPFMLIGFLPLLGRGDADLEGILGALSGVLSLVIACPASLYGLFLALLTPALQIRLAETGEIAACLRVKEVVQFAFANIGSIVIALLVIAGIGTVVVGPLTLLTFGLLAWPLGVLVNIALAHLYGQIARQAETKL